MEIRIDTNPEGMERLRNAVDAFLVTGADLAGPVLARFGEEHRRQERRIFASEGAEGGVSSWPPLHPEYAKFKEEAVGRQPILVWSGDMRDRFLSRSRPEYVQAFEPRGDGGVYLFGAQSEIAAKHAQGAAVEIRPQVARSRKTGKRIVWPSTTIHVQLPVRDMLSKSLEQVARFQAVFTVWYRDERVPQAVRALERARQGGRGPGGPP